MDASQGSRKAVLLVVLVFVLGIALGSVGTYVVTTRVLAAHSQVAPHPSQHDGDLHQRFESDSGPAEADPGDPERHPRAATRRFTSATIPNTKRPGKRAGTESGKS